MTFIGVDLGTKKVGLAVENEGIAFPLAVVSRVSLVNKLKKLIKERGTKTIVVGLPYDLYGKDTKRLDKTNAFIKKLGNIFPEQKIVGFDERFTTFEAINSITSIGMKVKGNVDDISACLILESYLSKK